MNLHPLYCTIEEGGSWVKCPEGYTVSLEALDAELHGRPKYAFKITLPSNTSSGTWNYWVHSFIFDEPSKKHCPRWDSMNGWTSKILEPNEEVELSDRDKG